MILKQQTTTDLGVVLEEEKSSDSDELSSSSRHSSHAPLDIIRDLSDNRVPQDANNRGIAPLLSQTVTQDEPNRLDGSTANDVPNLGRLGHLADA